MHLQAVIDAWVRSSVWQYRKVLPHYPTIRRCPLRASCFAFLAQRVRGLRRVRDGLKVEREALGVRHGDYRQDRKSVVEGKSVSVRVDLGGRRLIKKKQIKEKQPGEYIKK